MKWYKVCNRISLLLHALCSALGYFLIEMISRRSFSAAWTYMTTKPLVFAYNAALIFTTSLIVYLFRRRCFWRVLISILWLLLGIINGVILSNRVTPFTGPDLHLLTDGMAVSQVPSQKLLPVPGFLRNPADRKTAPGTELEIQNSSGYLQGLPASQPV